MGLSGEGVCAGAGAWGGELDVVGGGPRSGPCVGDGHEGWDAVEAGVMQNSRRLEFVTVALSLAKLKVGGASERIRNNAQFMNRRRR